MRTRTEHRLDPHAMTDTLRQQERDRWATIRTALGQLETGIAARQMLVKGREPS